MRMWTMVAGSGIQDSTQSARRRRIGSVLRLPQLYKVQGKLQRGAVGIQVE